jgi:hypothetical protein
MPEWLPPPSSDATELDQILFKIASRVASDPSVIEVTGIDVEVLSEHAVAAVKTFMDHFGDGNPLAMIHPANWAMLYIGGFIVGQEYQRTHPVRGGD